MRAALLNHTMIVHVSCVIVPVLQSQHQNTPIRERSCFTRSAVLLSCYWLSWIAHQIIMSKLAAVLALCLAVHGTCAANIRSIDGKIVRHERRCSERLTESACLGQHCFFCESSPVQGYSGCFEEARLIPKRFYNCKASKQAQQQELISASIRKQASNPADPCEGKPDAQSCDALDECTWCKSAAVPSSCFTKAQAKFLPPAVFVCDKKPTM